MGGGYHAHIDFHRFQSTHRIDCSLLQNTQQLHLHVQRQVTNFVQKNGTAVGQFKTPNAVGHGAGKGAFAMTKQFAFQQIFGNGCTIDGHKISAATVGLIVQGTRHQLFARSALTRNEHCGIGRRHALNQMPNGFGTGTGANKGLG